MVAFTMKGCTPGPRAVEICTSTGSSVFRASANAAAMVEIGEDDSSTTRADEAQTAACLDCGWKVRGELVCGSKRNLCFFVAFHLSFHRVIANSASDRAGQLDPVLPHLLLRG